MMRPRNHPALGAYAPTRPLMLAFSLGRGRHEPYWIQPFRIATRTRAAVVRTPSLARSLSR